MTDKLFDLQLGIICSVPAARDAEGRLWCNHAMGRLLDTLRRFVPGTKLCIPVLSEAHKAMAHPLEFTPDEVFDLPPLSSVIKSQRLYFETRRRVLRFSKECDLLFMRVPFQVPMALRNVGKPKLMHVISNPFEVISVSSDFRGLMRLLAVRFAAHSNATMRRMAHEPMTRVVTNGQEMWDVLGARAGRVVVSSCIYEREMRPRENLTLSDPPRLLFVGYLRPEKGIRNLLEAFEMLRKERPLKLTLVGGSDKKTMSEIEAHERVRNSPYRDDITITGLLDFGEPLFNIYRTHDIMVVPSLSEGTPRTVVEARSFGCPVVATRVGGIPTSVQHGKTGLLVEPNDSQGLAAAIKQLLTDDSLRRGIIANGLQASTQQTLEYFTGQLVDELKILADEIPAGGRAASLR